MPEYRRLYKTGGTYFFTVVTHNRSQVLNSDKSVALFMDCLEYIARVHPFVIEALVILPDHLHTIWRLPEGDNDFSTRWNRIKGRFSRRYGANEEVTSSSRQRKREKAIWQRRFWEHLVRDQDDFNRLCDYIHYNPVKHGLVALPENWKHSTFKEFLAKGLYPPDWGATIAKELKEMLVE